jgi:hypothetical protein
MLKVVVDGGVNANASLASESFGESTVIGSGDPVVTTSDARARISDDPSLSNDAFRDRATRDDPPSLVPSSAAAAAAARLRGLSVLAGISRNSNFFGLSRPPSRPNRSTNAPHVTSPRSLDLSLASTSLSLAARPPPPRRRLAPRPLVPRAFPLVPRLNPAIASSSARTSSPLSSRDARALVSPSSSSLGVADVGRVVLPLSTSSSSVASVARVMTTSRLRAATTRTRRRPPETSEDDDEGTARRDAMRRDGRMDEWMDARPTQPSRERPRCALFKNSRTYG